MNGTGPSRQVLAGLELGIAVAVCAGLGRGLIEKNRPPLYIAPRFVAASTRDAFMSAIQGKTGISIMIEGGRDPAGGRVAIRAGRWRARAGELTGVRILVAPFTVLRCVREA